MPTREQQTNARRFTAGAISGTSGVSYTDSLNTFPTSHFLFRHDICILYISTRTNTRTHGIPHSIYAQRTFINTNIYSCRIRDLSRDPESTSTEHVERHFYSNCNIHPITSAQILPRLHSNPDRDGTLCRHVVSDLGFLALPTPSAGHTTGRTETEVDASRRPLHRRRFWRARADSIISI